MLGLAALSLALVGHAAPPAPRAALAGRAGRPRMRVGATVPAELAETLGIAGQRAAVFALKDGPSSVPALEGCTVCAVGYLDKLEVGGASCLLAQPGSALRFQLQQLAGAGAARTVGSFSFVADASGEIRGWCDADDEAAHAAAARSAYEAMVAAPASDAEERVRAAQRQEAAAAEAKEAAAVAAQTEEERLLEAVRSGRPPRPEVLRGINKMRWEAEEREAVEALRKRQQTPEQAAYANTMDKQTVIARGVFGVLVVAVAAAVNAFVSGLQQSS